MDPIPLFPLSNTLFPSGVLGLRIFEVRYLDMIKKCIANQSAFGVVPLLSGSEVRTPNGQEILAEVGTLAHIEEWSAPMPGLMQLRCTGTTRFRLTSCELGKYGLWTGSIDPIDDDPIVDIPAPLQGTADALGQLIAQLQKDGVASTEMPLMPPFRLDESGWVADRWCELLPMPPQRKATLLGLQDPLARLEYVHELLADKGLV